ncbi:MAG: CapA family protein [Saprospirales bacterium]|nr:CapA family protein [Saprospirales bacterium]MBK7335198.1 CapA family protein [Saprospirales bacterium]
MRNILLFVPLFLLASLPLSAQEASPMMYSIIGVGDIMMGTNYPSPSYLPPNDGKDLMKDVLPILKDADITFGNLEGAILTSGGTAKTCKNPDVCYVFRSPEHYVDNLVDAGFDFMSLANNHSGDFGAVGRQKTKEMLRKAGIQFAGLAGTDEYAIITRDSVKYGLVAFAPNSGTCDIRNLVYAEKLVAQVAAECDIVIVSFHGGAEGATNQRVPKAYETYYGENRGNVHAFAHTVIDAGADVVFGHGPHVTRAMELYKGRIIAYSLGNFCTYGRFSLSGPAGFAPILKVFVDSEGAFIQGEITSVYQMKAHGPKIDPQKQALKKLIELTGADFPGTPLHFSDDGTLTPTRPELK